MDLYTVYQPIKNLHTNVTIGYEALLRGPLPPERLFQIAKDEGSLSQLDQKARELALQGMNRLDPKQTLFVNCHPLSLNEIKKIDFTLHPYLSPSQIILELTEHDMCNLGQLKQLVRWTSLLGIRWAIDDYGNGFTNLTLLKVLQPAFIKLDREITKTQTKNDYMLLVGIRKMAEWMGIEIIAEGIETREQMEFLIECGMNLGQGYYLGKPAPLYNNHLLSS
jgi:EAL domain-containing protein (putative c-di-GMP-specific phosphodiesterase class I)